MLQIEVLFNFPCTNHVSEQNFLRHFLKRLSVELNYANCIIFCSKSNVQVPPTAPCLAPAWPLTNVMTTVAVLTETALQDLEFVACSLQPAVQQQQSAGWEKWYYHTLFHLFALPLSKNKTYLLQNVHVFMSYFCRTAPTSRYVHERIRKIMLSHNFL